MRRTILALTVIALVAAMAGIAALSVTAQEDSTWEGEPTDPYPWEDTTSDPTDPEPDQQREARTICAPEWLIEWEPWYGAEGAWWVGWWYQWCHTNRYGWWRSYDSWFWGPPVY